MQEKQNKDSKNTGATTIVVVCVMAVIMALSMGLFLTASVLTRTSGRTLATEQSRILAVSFSEEVEKMLTDPQYSYSDRVSEEKGRAENTTELSLWHYVKQNISSGAWPYYMENVDEIHSRANAVRTFQIQESSTVGEITELSLTMYWTPGARKERPGQLWVETTAKIKDQACSITDLYELNMTGSGDYEKWEWKHVEKR